jgi:glycosidase/predicted small lipoprotein YifL
MALILTLSLAACGQNGTPNLTPNPSAPDETAPASETPSQQPVDPVYGLGTVAQNASGNKEGVYYEVFVRAFADSNGDGIGDLKGLTQKLDYLNDGKPETTHDLGVTGIWMMPINPSPSYHGYDVTNYYDINPEYGTLEDFDTLISEAHKRGISVIMDLVLNHTSDKHPWFIKSADMTSPYRKWYTWTVDGSEGYSLNATVWGSKVWNKLGNAFYYAIFWSGMPDLNYDNPEVREEVKNIASFWLNRGVDGFRLDAVPHIYGTAELPNNASGIEKTVSFWKEFTDHCHQINPEALIIGEVLEDNVNTRATYLPALDSTFHIGLGTQITNAIKAGSSKNNYLAKFIESNYAAYAKANPNYVDAPILSNHDQNRIIGSVLGKHELMKMAANIYLTLEGIPFIYYGEEIGMFGAKPDEDIRLPYVWGEDAMQTRWRESKYKDAVTPVTEQEKDPNSLLNHYKRLIRVKNENEALYAGKFKALESSNDAVVLYAMTSENQTALVIHNLSKEAQSLNVDTTGYTLKFCQTKEGFEEKDGVLNLPPLSSVIYVK